HTRFSRDWSSDVCSSDLNDRRGVGAMTENIILRRKVSRSFTTLPNDLIRDKQLSWKALGQLVFLLSLPPSFRLSLAFLTKQKKRSEERRVGKERRRTESG